MATIEWRAGRGGRGSQVSYQMPLNVRSSFIILFNELILFSVNKDMAEDVTTLEHVTVTVWNVIYARRY